MNLNKSIDTKLDIVKVNYPVLKDEAS